MTAIAKSPTPAPDALEQVLLTGDLTALSAADRVLYYKRTCESLGLNPLTKPFEYIKLNGKLALYARKDATDQLRKLNGVSIEKPDIQQIDNLIIVTVCAIDRDGRTDSDIGVVGKDDMGGNVGNALMKAVTKAKRRVTLSICGLGMLDETEVETIPNAQPIPVEVAQLPELPEFHGKYREIIAEWCQTLNHAGDSIKWSPKTLKAYINELFDRENGLDSLGVEDYETLIGDLEGRFETLQTQANGANEDAEIAAVGD